MINILMIEDDTEFAELLSEYLAQYDIKVTNYEDPYLGLSAGVKKYDLLIVDLTLPGMDGLEVCKEVVEKYNIPIIISSARSDINDKVEGFALGADDYLPKPYDPKEMYARIISLLRRSSKSTNSDIATPQSDFEIKGDTIYFKAEALTLTPAEFEVLSLLVKHQGITQSREQIINTAHNMSIDSQGKSLDVIISKIRTKIGDHKRIQAVRGVGYKLV
ncbi:MAG TPA: response regulator transcription factor [Sulfurovum sp.]|jgi:two-component system OmpR family response regulator|nr:MAG: DNA-binding response regulator [Sulfurovum sp. 35-42-20]OYY56778.1 MAG: DNA-binding response regulator [Sulfurovum sp. 28-43-6]OYZ25935.1 MAG: DNA-binding response regulator [Sulfurovum sp. 16-42-52]OYZ47793.1 MAG: DNA-binding response regulator [Sulfurovum sp. 24-42-9]OZA46824.1 MAG: DNA-binding response regulator [Sulfurovum sp. 17-42-90]OZA59137.1 MAG: DNA-binding response regulator [Sulfurovum sp. 39-42-12]HQR74224.1 response regulator transcription factor [Sulfurovum sp.]